MTAIKYRILIASLLLSGMLCGNHAAVHAQITTTANQTALALAQKLAGPGITILNPTLSCPVNGNGFFRVVTSNLGLDSGIVLSTGRVSGISGPASANASTNNGAAGDAQLTALAGSNTFDACKLEFDLIPKGDTIRFDYVFGSEEYNTSTCGTYNDAFAFFISGPGIIGQQNIARVPGTNIPVAVNSINSGVPGSQGNIANCTSMGAGSPFTSYYVDNTTGTTITYRGFTTVLKAVSAVTACSTYHLKIAIVDAGNGLFDSGVFIKAGSLKTNSFSIKADSTPGSSTPVIVKGCQPGTMTVKRSQVTGSPQTIKFMLGGTALNGTDYAALPDSVVIPAADSIAHITINGLITAATGIKTIKVYLLSPYACNGIEIIDSAMIDIHDGINTTILSRDTVFCKGNSVAFHVDGNPTMTYSWSPATGLNNPNIREPIATPDISTRYVLTTTAPNTGCPPGYDTIFIEVHQPPVIDAGADVFGCEGSGDVRLNASVILSEEGNSYQWQGPGGFTSGQLNPSLPGRRLSNGTYVFRISSEYCPVVTDSVKVTISDPPLPPTVISPVEVCLNTNPDPLRVSGQQLLWYNDATGGNGTPNTPSIPANLAGTYIYYVSQTRNQCEGKRSRLEVIVEKCCGDEVFIPSAFSPNGDGRNDRFNIHTGEDDLVVEYRIFNRWGQVVFHGRNKDAWDGTFNGQVVDMGTYFYDILIGCKRGNSLEKKGEVTIVY